MESELKEITWEEIKIGEPPKSFVEDSFGFSLAVRLKEFGFNPKKERLIKNLSTNDYIIFNHS